MICYSNIADKASGRLLGADGGFEGLSIDSREIKAGDLFVALRGERYDAHQFIDQAVSNGAAAVMVEQAVAATVPQIIVNDTRQGLGMAAKLWRQQFDIPVIAVTGSNGKTTVKEMLASILSRMGETLVTAGNYNNDIGVPLTLLRLRERHRYAVIEMGANHQGEIRYLTHLAEPHVALITNAGPAHLEGFGSIDGVANAKAEIFESLTELGHGIVNADDAYAPLWREKIAHCQNIEFGLKSGATVRGDWNAGTGHLNIHTRMGEVSVQLPLIGEHNASNALAATAAAMAVGAGLEEVRHGLEAMHPIKGRLMTKAGKYGLQILDDTYNANPASLKAGLQVLAATSKSSWLILGDMAELGENSEQLHAQVGELARELGIERLFAVGKFSAAAVESFGGGAEFFRAPQDLLQAVQMAAAPGVHVLVKGSRAMRMERVVAELLAEGEANSQVGFAQEV